MNVFVGDGSSSDSSSDYGQDFVLPNANPGDDDGFIEPRRKRQKTGREAKESAALGVFGSESEDDGSRQRWKAKSLRGKGIGFTKSSTKSQDNEDTDEQFEGEEEGANDDEEMPGVGLNDTAGLRSLGARGLGNDGNTPNNQAADGYQAGSFSMGTPLGKGWTPTSARQPILKFQPPVDQSSTPTTIRPSFSTPTRTFPQNGKGKSAPGPSAVNPNSFAAKMMAKMGYKEGQGLGVAGRGRLAPIETQLRPQGAGLGAVKEKTKQAKEEEKREAAFRGEILEDSSEEERKRRRKQKEKRMSGIGSGSSTPGGTRGRPKLKYRTAAEIEAAADGLHVPNVLKSIIDVTGKETKLLTSTSGLMTPNESMSMTTQDTESMKLARRARRDLEAFVDEWNGLSDRKKYFELQSSQLTREIDDQQEEIRRLQSITDAVQQLQEISAENNNGSPISSAWEKTTVKLESLEIEFRDEIDTLGLEEVAVAAIHPLFRIAMQDWHPLEDPTGIVHFIQRSRRILGIGSDSNGNGLALQHNGFHHTKSHTKSTTHYETLMYTLWLPTVRTVIANEWDVHDPSRLISLIEAWRSVLPAFILANVIDQLVVQRLTAAVADWKPRGTHKRHNRHTSQPPHIWLFPWLQYLDEQHTDPRSPTGLLTDVKRKFRTVIDTWPLSQGIPPGLHHWRQVLGAELDSLLVRHLLPRLALHLQENLVINPQDQDLTPLEQALAWLPFFKPSTTAHLLAAELFPKWHEILYIWLTSSPNYDEIRQWFLWWKEQIPAEIGTLPLIEAEWTKGLETINLALELGDDAVKTDLPPPAAVNFKDVLEQWSSDQDLVLLPLREAHPQTGLPLFRITASATGKGGVVVYLKGDVVWARGKGENKGSWKPVGLDEGLAERAGER
ncbi:hypothetical protein MMC24_003832 [Lignoscripta atroalba]|nr:hypothetical protein [Lignoscripta atroalba]